MINIRIVTIGKSISDLDIIKIRKWESRLFVILDEIRNYTLNTDSDAHLWAYSDKNLQKSLPTPEQTLNDSDSKKKSDITIYVLDVQLENNYFSRILDNNRILISYFEIKEILRSENIPLENFLISLLYSYSLLFLAKREQFLSMKDEENIAHDAFRGCLFDMCGIKSEIIHSCVSPIICDMCKTYLKRNKVSENCINIANKELKRIKKDCYYRIISFMKKYPIWALFISGTTALILNILANYIYSLFL